MSAPSKYTKGMQVPAMKSLNSRPSLKNKKTEDSNVKGAQKPSLDLEDLLPQFLAAESQQHKKKIIQKIHLLLLPPDIKTNLR